MISWKDDKIPTKSNAAIRGFPKSFSRAAAGSGVNLPTINELLTIRQTNDSGFFWDVGVKNDSKEISTYCETRQCLRTLHSCLDFSLERWW